MNDDFNDFEECNCDCHRNSNMRHVVACCCTCKKCDKRIQSMYYEEHIKKCK